MVGLLLFFITDFSVSTYGMISFSDSSERDTLKSQTAGRKEVFFSQKENDQIRKRNLRKVTHENYPQTMFYVDEESKAPFSGEIISFENFIAFLKDYRERSKIYMVDVPLGKIGCILLSQNIFRNPKITHLTLRKNNVSDEEMVFLVDIFLNQKNDSCISLSLVDNHLSGKGFQEGLKLFQYSRTFQVLDFSNNSGIVSSDIKNFLMNWSSQFERKGISELAVTTRDLKGLTNPPGTLIVDVQIVKRCGVLFKIMKLSCDPKYITDNLDCLDLPGMERSFFPDVWQHIWLSLS